LARSEDEFKKFERMDNERIMKNAGRPRLMEESELPAFLCKSEQDIEEAERIAEQDKLYGTGSRRRNEVNYGEGLTEEQWLNAVDNGEDVNAIEAEAKSKRGGTAKRKRDESDGEQAGTSKEQRKKAKREKGEKLPPLPTDLIQKMKALIDYIVEYEDNEGRRLSDPFMMLPPKKDLPDYYELIKRPVDIQKIRNRIRKENYRNLEDLESDVMLMCANTQQYNIDGSLIFEDSVILQSVFTSAKQMLQKSGQLPNATTIKS